LIPLLLRSIRERAPFTVNGKDYATPDGTCIRDYIHVYDLATAHLAALEALFREERSLALNVGTGTGHSILQVCKAAEKATGKCAQIVYGPRRTGDPAELVADPARIEAELNWKPVRSSLPQILEDAWVFEQMTAA
jgi:UDP-glucose 4-epimerase